MSDFTSFEDYLSHLQPYPSHGPNDILLLRYIRIAKISQHAELLRLLLIKNWIHRFLGFFLGDALHSIRCMLANF